MVATSALATAFAAGPNGGFTLAFGGALPVNITVTNFTTVTTDNVGGLTLQANAAYIPTVPVGPPNPGNPNNVGPNGTTALPNLNQLVWTQITYDNYFPPSTKAAPATLLDSYKNNGGTGGPPPADPANQTPFNQACVALPALPAGGAPATFPAGGAGVNGATGQTNAYCDPIYPFQGQNGAGNPTFSDTPTGSWTVPASFRAIDFLSSISNVGGTPTLTVYDNAIAYGFDLAAPEPSFRMLVLAGALLIVVVRARRRTASTKITEV